MLSGMLPPQQPNNMSNSSIQMLLDAINDSAKRQGQLAAANPEGFMPGDGRGLIEGNRMYMLNNLLKSLGGAPPSGGGGAPPSLPNAKITSELDRLNRNKKNNNTSNTTVAATSNTNNQSQQAADISAQQQQYQDIRNQNLGAPHYFSITPNSEHTFHAIPSIWGTLYSPPGRGEGNDGTGAAWGGFSDTNGGDTSG